MKSLTRYQWAAALISLILTTLACASGPIDSDATQIANLSTATPGGHISISLLTPTASSEALPGFGGQVIGPIATQTAEAQAAFAATSTAQALIPTPTIPGVFSEAERCPTPSAATLPNTPPSFTRFPALIAEFLSDGGAPTILEASLRSWGALNELGGLVRADRDFTADGVPEVLIVAFDPDRIEDFPPPGDLLIFGCDDGTYRLLYQAGYATDRSAPILYSADDINADRINDVVYSTKSCDEIRCIDQVFIIEWSIPVENFASLLSQNISETNAEIVVSDVDEDRLIEVSVTSGLIPLPDAGPQRQVTRVYKWDGSLYTVAEIIRPVAEYRIHLIHEGDDALLSADYETAIDAYREARDEDDLQSWTYPDEVAYLQAFARFRLMLTYVRQGNLNRAQTAHDELVGIYNPTPLPPCDAAVDPSCPPTPTPFFTLAGIEFVRMADLFWNDYSINRNIGQSCGLVVAYARATPAALDVLNSFGFANRSYEPEDICPFTSSR